MNAPTGRGRRRWWLAGLALAALVVVLAAAFASPDPDGLERVAQDHGFLDRAQSALYHLIPDYVLPGVGDPLLATIGAGLVGLVVVFGIVVGLGFLLRRRSA
ncbi:MAG TPA: PDGLE domain-containing protein [Candidatus Binatia bacterium]|nr:PDGLE domain-containing protein [Candidatus Binatia bacterium]